MDKKPRVIYMTPQGRVFNQEIAEELSKEESLIFLCGHYEGIDERVLDEIVTDHLSIGDYVLTGGELPAMVMIDTIARLVPGCLTTVNLLSMTLSRTVFWNIPSIQGRRSGMISRYRKSFCPDITAILKSGADSSL